VSTVYTIGHSTHTLERFLELLGLHRIEAIADVRSQPYSGFNPQFNREDLRRFLWSKQITYGLVQKQTLAFTTLDRWCNSTHRGTWIA